MDSIKIEYLSEYEDDIKFETIEDAKETKEPNTQVDESKPSGSKKGNSSRARKHGSTRVQHYRVAWEKNPMFSSWLKPGRNSRKALCIVCQSDMTADISVLKYHALCTKHLSKMAAAASDNNASSTMLYLDYEPEIIKRGFYNTNWEEDRRYGSWISPGFTERQAHCRLCNVQMSADTGALRRHLATYSHMKAAEFDDQLQAITSIVLEKHTESIDVDSNFNDEDHPDTVMVLEISHQDEGNFLTRHQTNGPSHKLRSLTYKLDDRADPLEKLSFIIGKFLLKGHKMLNASCDKCGCVLLQDRKKSIHCVGCQYGLMEEINAPCPAGRHSSFSNSNHWRQPSPPPLSDVNRVSDAGGDDASNPLDAVSVKEEVDEVTEIVISEDSDVMCRVLQPMRPPDDGLTPATDGCDVAGVDLSSEVSSLVVTLRARLVALTDQLEQDLHTDTCLLDLDKTVTALTKLKHL